MKVKGTQTTVQTVDVEISDAEIDNIIFSQPVERTAQKLQEKMMHDFLVSLEPRFDGKRRIGPSYRQDKPGLALIHVDADWNYHNNVGEDEVVRLLTEQEVERYRVICNLAKTITDLQK